MRIIAIICVRNEARYLAATLSHLAANGIAVVVLDNDSSDESSFICDSYRQFIVERIRLPYCGCFNLSQQIAAKAEVIRRIDADWVIHQDADEVLESPRTNETLHAGITRVSLSGSNVVNFDEFVFVPRSAEEIHYHRDFYESMLSYYFFEPSPLRLMRAWRNDGTLSQADGGHRVQGNDVRIAKESFVLRHYPCLSLEHAQYKYAARTFAREDLDKGWHRNRLDIDPTRVLLPNPATLKALAHARDKAFDRSDPWRVHFWESAQRTSRS